MEQVVTKFFATFSFKNDNSGFNDFNKSLDNTNKSLFKLKAGLVVATTFLLKFTNDTLKGFVNFDNFIKRTGVDETFASTLMNMARVSNISADTITASLEKISRDKQDFLRGEGNISPYAFLGIDVANKGTEQVFNEILEKVNQIEDAAKRSKALRDLGLNENLTNLNANNLKGVNRSLFLNNDDRKRLNELNNQVGLFILNMKLLRDKFIALATPITLFFELLNRLTKVFVSVIENTIGLSNAVKIFTASFLVMLTMILPAIITKFSIFLLVLDDVITFFKGGDSVIGTFIKKLKELWSEATAGQKILASLGVIIAGIFATAKIVQWGKTLGTVLSTLNSSFIKTPLGLAIMGTYAVGKAGKKFGDWTGEKIGGFFDKKAIEKAQLGLDKSRQDVLNRVDKNVLANNRNYNSNLNNNVKIENNYNISGVENPNTLTNTIVSKEAQQIDNFTRTN